MNRSPPDTALMFQLIDLNRLYREALSSALENAGIELNPGEIRTLAYIVSHPGFRQSNLVEVMGVEPMTVSVSISRLLRLEFVTREADSRDRRASLIHATTSGHRMFETLRPIAEAVYDQATVGLTEAQIQATLSSLGRIVANLRGAGQTGIS